MRQSRLTIAAVVALGALVLGSSACSKGGETSPKETPKSSEGKAKEGEAGPGKTADKAADDKKTAGATTDDKKAEDAPGAVDPAYRTPVAQPDKKGTGGTTSTPPTPTPFGAGKPPKRPIIVAGTPSLTKLAETVQAFAAMGPASGLMAGDPKAQVVAGLQAALGVKNTDWLDLDKPLRMFLVDPQRSTEDGVLLLPLSDKGKLMAALGDNAKKNQDGHDAIVNAMGRNMYLDVVDSAAVLATTGDVVKNYRAVIADDILKWTPKKPLEIRFDVASMTEAYDAQMKSAQKMAKELYAQMAKAQGNASMGSMTGANVDMLFDFANALKTATLRLDAKDKHAFADVVLHGKDGSGLLKFAAGLKGKRSALANTVPANAYFAAVTNIDTRDIEGLRQLYVSAMSQYAEVLQISDEAIKKKLVAIIEKAYKLQTGDTSMAIYKDGQFPVALHYTYAVEDAAKMQAVYHELTTLLIDSILKAAEASGQKMPPLADKTLVGLIKAANDVTEKMLGVKLDASSGTVAGAQVDVLKVVVDWDKVGPLQGDPEQLKLMKSFGNTFQLAFAYAGKTAAVALGPNGEKTAAKLATGKYEGGNGALTAVAKDHPVAAVVHAGALVEAFKDISPGLADKKEAIALLAKAAPFVMTSNEEEGAAVFAFDVPFDTVAALTALFR